MFEAILNAFRAPDLRRRILFVAGMLIVFRLLAHVPIPGVDRTQLSTFLETNPIFGLLDLDDVRPQPGEQLRRRGARLVLRQVQDLHPLQCRHATPSRALVRRARPAWG